MCSCKCHWYHMMPMPIASHYQKVMFHHHDVKKAMMPFMTPSTSLDANPSANGITWPRRLCYTSFQLSWCKECNTVTHLLWCYQHHVMLMPEPMALHGQKGNDTSHFDCLDLKNGIALLVMPLTSDHSDTGGNGITWPQKSFCTSFWWSWPKKCSGACNNVDIYILHTY